MNMKRVIQSFIIASLILGSQLTFAQYGDEPFIEGFVGANYTLPMGYIKNDLKPDSLNAGNGFGLDVGVGYYLRSNLVTGLYFNIRNMAAKDFDLYHRVYEFGGYGKFFLADITESSLAPYIRVSAGLNISKLATEVARGTELVYRELSHKPTLGTGINLGVHYKTNEYGALFAEVAFHYDFMDGVTGEYKGQEYEWGDNNQYMLIKLGVLFNIGAGE